MTKQNDYKRREEWSQKERDLSQFCHDNVFNPGDLKIALHNDFQSRFHEKKIEYFQQR